MCHKCDVLNGAVFEFYNEGHFSTAKKLAQWETELAIVALSYQLRNIQWWLRFLVREGWNRCCSSEVFKNYAQPEGFWWWAPIFLPRWNMVKSWSFNAWQDLTGRGGLRVPPGKVCHVRSTKGVFIQRIDGYFSHAHSHVVHITIRKWMPVIWETDLWIHSSVFQRWD